MASSPASPRRSLRATAATAPAILPRTAVVAAAIFDAGGGAGRCFRRRVAADRAALFLRATVRVARRGADLRAAVLRVAFRGLRVALRVAFFANRDLRRAPCTRGAERLCFRRMDVRLRSSLLLIAFLSSVSA